MDFWAYDQTGTQELDPQLQAAHCVAVQESKEQSSIPEEEQAEPLILRNLLSRVQIENILSACAAEGVWPRGLERKQDDGDERTTTTACTQLQSVAHHYAWTADHTVLYMHNNDYWFVRALPEQWAKIRGGMEATSGNDIPVLADGWGGVDNMMGAMSNVRTIELHHYGPGGGLLTPGHRDCGSEQTISVLLSDPTTVQGGDFVTYDRHGVPVAHAMKQGDAILFASNDLHNISTVTSGIRQSLVVEL